MNYFVLTFQYWNQSERRIIKSSEESVSKIQTELISIISEIADEYRCLTLKQNNAWKSGDQKSFWVHYTQLADTSDKIRVLDFEVNVDDFISEDWDGYNHFKIQTLTEWAEEQYMEQNQ